MHKKKEAPFVYPLDALNVRVIENTYSIWMCVWYKKGSHEYPKILKYVCGQ